jgi:hypothetical protein
MSALIPQDISALLVEFTVIGNAMPPRDPNDDDDDLVSARGRFC